MSYIKFDRTQDSSQALIGDSNTIYLTTDNKIINNGKEYGNFVMQQYPEDTTITIDPNIFYVWDEVDYLDITLNDPRQEDVYNEYMIEFISGGTPTTLSISPTIQWINSPNIEANKRYQISIVNGIGVIGGISNE